jgi:hypothetical protein
MWTFSNFYYSHPNGWDGVQQVKMRLAAIEAQLIPATDDGRARIHFVSEGEASFHWCVSSGLADNVLKVGPPTPFRALDC